MTAEALRGWPAPAKLNLFLSIVGRRADGYHLLQTVFQLLDYGDELFFEVRGDGIIERLTDLPGVPAQQDLTVRAAVLLQKTTATSLGVNIRINKRLPMGGGLGGGSSDAATTLVALNALWDTKLTTGKLVELALSLGADVPVFVQGFSAWAEGVGQELTPIQLPQHWYVVIVPQCQVSTREIFAAAELTRNAKPLTIADFRSGRADYNVCEKVVRNRYPAVAEALNWLSQYGRAQMSGTGSSVFAVFERKADAQRVLTELPPIGTGFVTQGVNVSPLLAKLTSGQMSAD